MATYINPDAIKDGTISASKTDETIATKSYVDTQIKVTNDKVDDFINAGYLYAGIATPEINPGIIEAKVFYIANGKGTYTNFGGFEVTEDEVVVLYYDTEWHKVATGIATKEELTKLSLKVGDLSQLQTTEKSNLVGAINEVAQGSGDAVLFTPQTLSSEQKTQALLNLSLANAWECIYKDITVEASADSQQLEFELGGVQDVYILFKREYYSDNTGNFKFNVDGMDTNASDITIKLQLSGVLFRIEPSWDALQRNRIGFGPAIYFWSNNNPASSNCALSYRSNEFVANVSPTKMNNLKITIKNLSNQLKLQIFTRK